MWEILGLGEFVFAFGCNPSIMGLDQKPFRAPVFEVFALAEERLGPLGIGA